MNNPVGHFPDELLNDAPMWVLASDGKSGALRSVNRLAATDLQLYGSEPQNLNEKSLWAVSGEREQFVRRLQQYGRALGEAELVKPNGEKLWALVSCQQDPSDAANILWWITDISVQRNEQLQRQQHELMLKQVLDMLPVAVYVKDVRDNLRYVLDNQKSKEMFGAPKSGVLGKVDAEISGPEMAKYTLQQDLEIIRTGEPYNNPEQLLELPDGDCWYISTKKVLVTDGNGEPSLIVGVSENVTERVETERALKISEKRFRDLVANSPVGVYLTDANGACIYVNDQWQKIAGISIEQAAGQGWLEALHPDDYDRVKKGWQEIIGSSPDSSVSMEFRFVCPDGRVNWVASTTVAFRNDFNQVVGYLGTNTDITRRKQFEMELQLSSNEAKRANTAKSEFLSRMSHELRTPLNAVLGFGQLLQMSGDNLTDKQLEGVDHILAAGEQLLHLIEDVLDFSRVEGGNLSMKMQETSISRVLHESISLVSNMALQYEISLSYKLESDMSVMADQRRLQQILVNLLTNAIKYNQKNGKVDIGISTRKGGVVRISIGDTGCGIRPEDNERLFAPFERLTGPESHVEGTGIGLSICKKLAELMGCELGYSSEFGVGSTFWVDLPVARLDVNALPGHDLTINSAALAPLRGTKILYIEDNLENIDLVMKVAQLIEDCAFYSASSALEGISLAKSLSPDLILMGITFPGIDGFTALELLRKDSRSRDIPVIAISSAASPEVAQKGTAAGFARFLAKPLELASFLQAIVDVRTQKPRSELKGKSTSLPHQ